MERNELVENFINQIKQDNLTEKENRELVLEHIFALNNLVSMLNENRNILGRVWDFFAGADTGKEEEKYVKYKLPLTRKYASARGKRAHDVRNTRLKILGGKRRSELLTQTSKRTSRNKTS
jgi:hypothetical protein